MSSTEVVHFYMSREDKQRKTGSKALFQPGARCGYGEPITRIKTTSNKSKVTCPACLHMITDT